MNTNMMEMNLNEMGMVNGGTETNLWELMKGCAAGAGIGLVGGLVAGAAVGGVPGAAGGAIAGFAIGCMAGGYYVAYRND